MRAEYDFDYSKAARGKYYRRLLKEGANVVVLDPDVAKAFRSSAAVNEALRSLLRDVGGNPASNFTLQRPGGKRPPLSASVDMTSAVKGHVTAGSRVRVPPRLVWPFHQGDSSHRRRRSLYSRRSIMLISVDWVPPYWCPSQRLLRSRVEGRSLVTRSKIAPIPGLRLPR